MDTNEPLGDGIRILFLSDTHIGFDWPQNPRVRRRRRGDDFWNNYLEALESARQGKVDLVIHGGDLLFRSKIPASLALRAMEPLLDLAAKGLPVCIIPGNHERSHLRRTLFDRHPNLYIFQKPDVATIVRNGFHINVAGFPHQRGDIRANFSRLQLAILHSLPRADFNILCMHHAVDGATVGPGNFMFRKRPDTIAGHQLSAAFQLFLGGHIHRHQILHNTPDGRRLPAPLIFAGSVERTSFAERDEDKGYYLIQMNAEEKKLRLGRIKFCKLPARPMHRDEIEVGRLDPRGWIDYLIGLPQRYAFDVVLRIDIKGRAKPELVPMLNNEFIRRHTPASMNIELNWRKT